MMMRSGREWKTYSEIGNDDDTINGMSSMTKQDVRKRSFFLYEREFTVIIGKVSLF